MHRQYKSGYKKRKERAQQEERNVKLTEKIPCLSTYGFQRRSIPADQTSSSETQGDANAEILQELEHSQASAASEEEPAATTDENIASTSHSHEDNSNLLYNNDVGTWPSKVTEQMRDFWAHKGSEECQHLHCDYTKSVLQQDGKRLRHCTSSLFYRKCLNGEKVIRSWLCYSPGNGKLYCFACKLFESCDGEGFSRNGYSDWKNAYRNIASHEISVTHNNAIISLTVRAKEAGRVDCGVAKQMYEEREYWTAVLRRVITVITFLAERGLAFWGNNEIVGSPHNGNFLGILELLAQFDPFMSAHIKKHANKGRGHTSYLSSTICEEFISMMGTQVLHCIVEEIKDAKYFSISVDSTPDISHCDQLTIVVRYVTEYGPVERFLTFLKNVGHKGRDLATTVLEYLSELGIDIANCRGQTYDNASNMSGIYNGMQTAVREVNPLAEYIPCCTHSLSLVGQAAANSCSSATAFFDFVQQLYQFFAASPRIWEKLTSALDQKQLVVKRLSDTRWSARADAVRALRIGYLTIWGVLDDIANDTSEKAETKRKAAGISGVFGYLETGFFTEFWDCVLSRFDSTSKLLQSASLSLNTVVQTLRSLKEFLFHLREEFNNFEQLGREKSGSSDYRSEKVRSRCRNPKYDYDTGLSSANECMLSGKEKFRADSFFPIIDQLLSALDKRVVAYGILSDRFSFLTELGKDEVNVNDIRAAGQKIAAVYFNDVEEQSVGNELLQFSNFVKLCVDEKQKDESYETFLHRIIQEKKLMSLFPNTAIILRMYLCLMCSNCSGERSFSKLKRIKNELRSSMAQQRLIDLSLMSIESELLRKQNFDKLIHEFACKKVRQVPL